MDSTVKPFNGSIRQSEIYQESLAGRKPAIPVSVTQLEQRAKEVLSPDAWVFVDGGAGGEGTMRANVAAFDRWRILPRMLRDIADRDLSVDVCGQRLPAPVVLGAAGAQGIVHPEGEVAAMRGAASLGIPFTMGTLTSKSLEQVAEAAAGSPHWFQLYPSKDSEITASLLARAERAGYSAVVLTLDASLLGWRERDLDMGFLPTFRGHGHVNYFNDPVFRARLSAPPEQDPAAATRHWLEVRSCGAVTWKVFEHVRRNTHVPLLLKGILHPEDARLAIRGGANGIIVSNHGGRQVDGTVAALDALPAVIKAVGNQVPVLLDSGVRRGAARTRSRPWLSAPAPWCCAVLICGDWPSQESRACVRSCSTSSPIST
jgi:isopentenyl diphosphate isomerase/L-lactate dehydrogenase-like FMN-dependent dehydrogenase